MTVVVGGSACTDFSSFGNHQMSAGPTTIYLLLLLRMVASFRPLIFIHENVVAFPLKLLSDCLQEMYDFEEVVLHADQTGWPVERKRKYCVGRLSGKILQLVFDECIFDRFRLEL